MSSSTLCLRLATDSFGDSIENDNSWLFSDGPALLDEHETNALTDFFENPDHFGLAASSAATANVGNHNDLFGDLDDWNQFLSPTNVQPASNISRLPTTTPAAPADPFQHPLPSFDIPDISQQQSATNNQDLDAALALLGANSNHPQPYAEDSFFTHPQANSRLPSHPVRHSISGPVPGQLPFGSATAGPLASDLVSAQVAQTNGQVPRSHAFRFGSDASFHPSAGFVAPPNTNTHVDIQKRLVHDMNAMGRRESAPSTRASSPLMYNKRPRPFADPQESDFESSPNAESEEEEEEDTQWRPKKRRRSTKLDIPSPPPLKTMPRRKSISQPKRRGRNSSSGDMGKANKQKENLTEEQKRSNHIQSEQKRRNIIKDAYNDLNKLVPNLREGGFSKSQALVEAANFLEDIVAGNKRLREILNANRLDD